MRGGGGGAALGAGTEFLVLLLLMLLMLRGGTRGNVSVGPSSSEKLRLGDTEVPRDNESRGSDSVLRLSSSVADVSALVLGGSYTSLGASLGVDGVRMGGFLCMAGCCEKKRCGKTGI